MAAIQFIISPNDKGGWALTKAGSNRATKKFETKKEAVDYSRTYAKKQAPCKLVVQKADGGVQNEFSYEKDVKPAAANSKKPAMKAAAAKKPAPKAKTAAPKKAGATKPAAKKTAAKKTAAKK